MYLRGSPILKVEVGVIVCIEFLQTLFYGLSKVMYNLCDTAYIIPSCSTSGIKYIGLTVLGSPLIHMEAKEKINMDSLEIDPPLLKNLENLLKPAWISNSGRIFLVSYFLFVFPKIQG